MDKSVSGQQCTFIYSRVDDITCKRLRHSSLPVQKQDVIVMAGSILLGLISSVIACIHLNSRYIKQRFDILRLMSFGNRKQGRLKRLGLK